MDGGYCGPYRRRPRIPGGLVFICRTAEPSNGEIAAWLNGQGFRTRTGRVFTAHAVKDMLHCRFYTGGVTFEGEESAGRHAAVVDEGLWERAQRHQAPRRRYSVRLHGVGRNPRSRCLCPLWAQPPL